MNRILENGIFYTPDRVAIALANGVEEFKYGKSLKIFDPSCGDGALLIAANSSLGSNNYYTGCDMFASETTLDLKKYKFYETDFFAFSHKDKFDLIITNPPYIQFGRLSTITKSNIHNKLSRFYDLDQRSDMWLYFLLKSVTHLKKNGAIAAVIPWSFLEADFSHRFREFLASKFSRIKILVLKGRHFKSTGKRILLLWLSGYGKKATNVKIGFSSDVEDNHLYKSVNLSDWSKPGLISELGLNSKELLTKAKEYGFMPLGSISKVTIGLVTGANKFFIREKADALNLGFIGKDLTPIYTKVNELNSLLLEDHPDQVLLKISLKNGDDEYVKLGEEQNYHERAHCRIRDKPILNKKWFEINNGPIADGFFTYRVSQIPYFSINNRSHLCTNSLHKVIFNNKLSLNQKKWIAISILSDVSQLSLEHNGRHYGSGILKIEPTALKNSLIFIPQRRVSNAKFNKISNFIANQDKVSASKLATDYLKTVTDLPQQYWKDVNQTLISIRDRRH